MMMIKSSILLVVGLASLSTTRAITPRRPFLSAIVRATLFRGGASSVDNVDGEAFFEAAQFEKKKKLVKKKTASPSKKKKRAKSRPKEVETTTTDEEATSPVLAILTTTLSTVWKLCATVLSALLSLLSPSATNDSQQTPNPTLEMLDNKKILTGSLAKAVAISRRRAKFLVALTSSNEHAVKIMMELQPQLKKYFVFWMGASSSQTPLLPGRLYVMSKTMKTILAHVPFKDNTTTASRTAAWLTELRKRHANELASLAKTRQEALWAKERKTGYTSSVQSDVQKRLDAAAQRAAEKAEQERAKARQEFILERRKELLTQLPEEPSPEANCVVVALRFADGTTGQRRFLHDETKLQTLFDWVDATFAMERETVCLRTLNGSHTLYFDVDKDLPLRSLNKKMIAFRVSKESPVLKTKEEDTHEDAE